MSKSIKTRAFTLAFAVVMALSLASFSTASTAKAADYGKKLKLNNELKFNKTKTFTKNALYHEDTFFAKTVKGKVAYTVKCKRKASGKKYVVTYDVTYKLKSNPQLQNTTIGYDDWYWGWLTPSMCYTVFDYKTGKSLEGTALAKKLGVKVEVKKAWNTKYYDKQYYEYSGELANSYDPEEQWLANTKSATVSFKVTYPKKCKRATVGIGFNSMEPQVYDAKTNNDYASGKGKWGDTTYYKTDWYENGKKKTSKGQFSYMRLK
ncbi:MAG: hypothetical protein K6G65_06280 [Lachnospiraceae bacterium]|nr:hypothetical protein [Lachnospiraceae bacterium]